MKVFLGGTVNDSKWRDIIMPQLEMDYFNPVTDDWNEAAHQRELKEREECDYCLYVITPKMIGYYSLAEVTDDAIKKPGRTIYCFLREDEDREFSEAEIISLEIIGKRITQHHAVWCRSLEEVVIFLNYVQNYGEDTKSSEQFKVEADYHSAYKVLEEATKNWKESDFNENYLWKEKRLAIGLVEVRKLENKPTDSLPDVTEEMRQFLDASKLKSSESRKPSIFISYSREPSTPLARGIYETLKENYDVWYDKESIPYGQDFKDAIEKGIRNADNFIYILSNNAVKSVYCQDELNTAKLYGKRIIPIQQESIEEAAIDKDIKDINRIFPVAENESWNLQNLKENIEKVIGEFPELVINHSHFLHLAVEWINGNFKQSSLLRGSALEQYNIWEKEFKEARLNTNQLTYHHALFGSESRMIEDLGFNEFWLICEDEAIKQNLLLVIDASGDKGLGYENRILKCSNLLFVLDEKTVADPVLVKQLVFAREHKVPVYFIAREGFDLSENKLYKENEPVFKWPKNEIIRRKDLEKAFSLDSKFQFYKTPTFLIHNAKLWENKVNENDLLLRDKALEHFETLVKSLEKRRTYFFPEVVKKYLNESAKADELSGYDIFISRQDCKANFAFWLGGQLLEQKLTFWNHHDYLKDNPNEQKIMLDGVEQSIHFVLVLSNAFPGQHQNILEDAVIYEQFEKAKSLGKKIFIIRNDNCECPKELQEYPIIDFDENPIQAAYELIKNLTVDRDYVKFLNELNQRAKEWGDSQNREDTDLLLRGFQLDSAIAKIEEKKESEYKPSTITNAFIEASLEDRALRAKRKKRTQRIIIYLAVASFILAIISVFFGIDASNKKEIAIEARDSTALAYKLADSLKIKAIGEAHRADSLKDEALQSKDEAIMARDSANDARKLAVRERGIAENERKKAQNLRKTSDTLFHLTKAKILANKVINSSSGLPIDAIHSYFLNRNKGGFEQDADIYSALYKISESQNLLSKPLVDSRGINGFYLNFPDQIFYWTSAGLYLNGEKIAINTNDLVASKDGKFIFLANSDGIHLIDFASKSTTKTLSEISALEIRIFEYSRRIFLALREQKGVSIFEFEKVSQSLLNVDFIKINYQYPNTYDIKFIDGGLSLVYGSNQGNVGTIYKNMYFGKSGAMKKIRLSPIEVLHRFSAISQASSGKVVAGTESGVILELSSDLYNPLKFTQAKSAIRKIDIQQNRIIAITGGNQLENSKIITRWLKSTHKNFDPSNFSTFEKKESSDLINDFFVSDGRIFYLENNKQIKSHSLSSSDLVASVCTTLKNCDGDKDEFFEEYYQEQEKPEFCSCDNLAMR